MISHSVHSRFPVQLQLPKEFIDSLKGELYFIAHWSDISLAYNFTVYAKIVITPNVWKPVQRLPGPVTSSKHPSTQRLSLGVVFFQIYYSKRTVERDKDAGYSQNIKTGTGRQVPRNKSFSSSLYWRQGMAR